jgi:hypothetical protein
MPWWPGWDSIESTDFWSTFYFWFGILCLLLLAIAEVVSHYYGQRHSELVTAVAGAAAVKGQQEQREADERHRAEIAEMQRRLEETQRQQASRRLTPEQQKSLIATLSPFAGQKVSVVCILGDTEGQQFANDFISVFRSAKWDYGGGSGINQAAYTVNPIGIAASVKEATPSAIPAPLGVLVVALADMGVMPGRNIGIDSALPPDTIQLQIGKKPDTAR